MPSSPPSAPLPRAVAARRSKRPGLVPVGLLVALVAAVPLAYRLSHGDAIYPGVRVAGIAVGGHPAADATARLAEAGLDPAAPVTLRTGDRTWTLAPGESGLAFDANATVTHAWEVGRRGARPVAWWHMLRARLRGHAVSPSVVFDRARARAALEAIADQWDRPARNAAIALEGTAVHATPAETGRKLDVDASLARLELAATGGGWPVRELELAIETEAPEVTDAGRAVSAAEQLLAEPLTLREGDTVWTLAPDVLAPMLTTRVDGDTVALDIDRARLAEWMKPITGVISHTAQLPRFRFDADAVALRLVASGREGKSVDIETTARRMLAAGASGERLIRIAVATTPPEVADTATAEELGIRELIRSETSRFAGSAPERIHNIAVAAALFDGLLVAPGAEFSFNEHLGDVSIERGFKKGLIIMDGATTDGVGGGVCQVSTTLFRTVFWSGLPITARTAHGYRVPYYEQGAPVGFDATVFSPVVDFRFVNDSGAWILIETETNTRGATTTFRFYGAKPNREVALEGPVTSKPVPPPPPRTEVDASLAPGQSRIVEHARSGLSVSLTRVIREPGRDEVREVYRSHYVPTGQITAVGPADAPADAVPGATQTTQNTTAAGAAPPP